MGLFSKSKKKTKVERSVTTTTETKIVKFTYLQSLAIYGGLGDVKALAGETKESEANIKDGKVTKDGITRALEKSAQTLPPILDNISRSIVNGLFGKKTSVNVEATIKDSGWILQKTWLEPQFDIIRYALGIKELSLAQFTYVPVSEIISLAWESPKEIEKVSLIVDQFVPKQFPVGPTYIDYYVKPDIDQADWIRINPIGLPTVFNDKGKIVPRIITFNTEKPVNSRLEESYLSTDKPVKSIKFKAVLKRPGALEDGNDSSSYSPILKSYRMMLIPRGSL